MRASRFSGRRAIVTGAASGIGAAITRALLAEGSAVVAVDISQPVARSQPRGLERFTTDVSDERAVVDLSAAVFQTGSIDALFNVAGVGSTTNAIDTSLSDWERVFAVNAGGTFLMCKHVLPQMVAAGRGTIVNIGSIAGLVGLPNRAAYCASKGAVIALTRALAVDHVDDHVRVNCVCPGTIDSPWVRRLVEEAGESLHALTARQPMGRLGTPDEVAQAALYLASDDAAFATGSILTLDGGLTAT